MNDLQLFIDSTMREINEEYQRIQKRAVEDPGTAGDQGEENWATLLKDWLPANFQVVTKGRIITPDGTASPQIDVLVLKPEYPRKLLDKKLYLSSGVLAAFECKITLKAEHIEKSVKTAKIIRESLESRKGTTPYKELNSPIIYGVLAHSHVWKSEGSMPLENIERKLSESDYKYTTHPSEMIDVICIADLACWRTASIVYMGEKKEDWSPTFEKIYSYKETTITSYIKFSSENNQGKYFSPIGTLIATLYWKLGWENKSLRELSGYFNQVIVGNGSGIQRHWDFNEVFSDEMKKQIFKNGLKNGNKWDEWGLAF
ncbi:DUF6602 domain-containing protein [Oceanobacillus oncorhynchi]|uniref:DUF6602 domain-containing protein n=1 Tax=Oceanobacillus oncorhynchi TaxID=545501 RepID=A0A0A1MIQ6_9BACI|nr:DUF6602 domain-containing protein [Oceanobacillus oncorhynchi]CEI82958.1 hypothetical protein BN997_02847 [Oceanobacillus oncorhynchi]